MNKDFNSSFNFESTLVDKGNEDIHQMIYILRVSIEEDTKLFHQLNDREMKIELIDRRCKNLQRLEDLYELLPAPTQLHTKHDL